MPAHKPTAEDLAVLVSVLIHRYAQERGKEISRFRLARTSLRRLAVRDRLRDALVEEWSDEMALTFGWIVFVHDDEFLLLKAEAAQAWTKIATKRCDDLIKRLRRGDATALIDAEKEIGATDSEEDDEESE